MCCVCTVGLCTAVFLARQQRKKNENINCNDETWNCGVQAKRPLHSCKWSAFLRACCFLPFCARELWSTIEIFFLCYYFIFALGCTIAPLLKQTKCCFSSLHIARFRFAFSVCLCTMVYYSVFLLGWFRRYCRFLAFSLVFHSHATLNLGKNRSIDTQYQQRTTVSLFGTIARLI